MKTRISHRWKIAIAAAVAAAFLFALVLLGAHALMGRMERRAAEELLDAPMSEVLNSLKSREPLDEEVGAQERVTVVVFDALGKATFRSGNAPVGFWHGDGEVLVAGRNLLYRSAKFDQSTIVATSDWTAAKNQLGRIRLLLLLLLIPLAAAVGVSAYVAAGLMYRPLRNLTSAARDMAAEGRVEQLLDPRDPDFSPLVRELNLLLTRIRSEMERQERLVSDVAHDLRTPLTVIRGRLETALFRNEADKYPDAMRIAVKETERLSVIADSILRSGEYLREVEPIELSSLTTEVVDRWKEVFRQQGVDLQSSIAQCRAAIAPEEWTSVLDNLLDNAFKYGGPSCRVSLEDGEVVSLTVCDNGPGIPEGDRQRVFERFTRLDENRTSDGHGLGLYLCCTILDSRGGGIGIIPSSMGHLVFRAWLPRV